MSFTIFINKKQLDFIISKFSKTFDISFYKIYPVDISIYEITPLIGVFKSCDTVANNKSYWILDLNLIISATTLILFI